MTVILEEHLVCTENERTGALNLGHDPNLETQLYIYSVPELSLPRNCSEENKA